MSNPEQATLREIALEDSLRIAANALRYAAELVERLAYPDTTASDFLRIRYAYAMLDLDPCEETERLVADVKATMEEHDEERRAERLRDKQEGGSHA